METLRAFSLPQELSFNVNPEGCGSCRGVEALLEIEDKPVPCGPGNGHKGTHTSGPPNTSGLGRFAEVELDSHTS